MLKAVWHSIFLLLASFLQIAAGAAVVDRDYPPEVGGFGLNPGQTFQQQVTVGVSGRLMVIELWPLSYIGSNPVLFINRGFGWQLDGNDLAIAITPANYPNPTIVDLSSAGLTFNAGEQFVIGLAVPDDASGGISRHTNPNGLTGALYINGQLFDGGVNFENWVLAHRTYMRPPDTPLSFPLAGLTAYTAKVSAVMDHSMTAPYVEDRVVLAFNGERGDRVDDLHQGCYPKLGGGKFGQGFKYVGTSSTGGRAYLCYDGHPGYDYPYPANTNILSPANGTLCVAHSRKRGPTSGTQVWRDPVICELASAPGQSGVTWTAYHTFYILHEPLTFDGVTAEYMTVFLHSIRLSESVMTEVQANGYATVTRNQHIADIGKFGTTGNHMHLEVYKKVGLEWQRVDPYGDGVRNILW